MATKNSGCDTQDLEQCIAWFEKQGTSAKLSEEEQNKFAKGVLSSCALSFIDYLDAHSYEGKMCVSNGECEDIENAFHNAMWDRLHRYYCKYIEKQDEQKPILDFKASNFYVSKVDGKIHDMTYNSTDKVEPKFKVKYAGSEYNVFETKDIAGVPFYGIEDEPNHIDYVQADNCEIISGYAIKENGSSYPTNPAVFSEQKPFDYENATITQKDFAPKGEPKFNVSDYIVSDYCMGRVIEITSDAYLLDIGQGIPFSCEYNVHLWTIQDAKDGDVLIDKSGSRECPFIFKETKPSDIKTDMLNPLAVLGYCGIGGAGFTKGSGWGDTANCIYYPATKEQRDTLFKKMKEAGFEWDAEKKELKKIHVIDEGKAEMDYCFTKMMAGEKVSPAWSDEDDYNLQCMIAKVTSDIQKGNVGRNNELIDWLKSLKDRVSWKPNKKQMETLEYYMHTLLATEHKEVLFGLYNDLKKL